MPDPTPAIATAKTNEEQSHHWNEVAGPIWVERQDVLDRMIGTFSQQALDRTTSFNAGESVLDVGCGTGQTTIEIARRVAPNGRVVGLDISRPMLAAAQRRPVPPGAVAIEFREADAQVTPIERAFDVVFSRFGVMFFADPVAAFRNLHGALRPTGRLAFLCWQPLARNPWVAGPMQAIAAVLPLPAPPPPGTPGPFSLGDPERVKEILGAAGFRGVTLEGIEGDLNVGDSRIEPTVEFLMKIGPCAALLRGAPPETAETVRSTLTRYFESVAVDGRVRQRGATWFVSARPA